MKTARTLAFVLMLCACDSNDDNVIAQASNAGSGNAAGHGSGGSPAGRGGSGSAAGQASSAGSASDSGDGGSCDAKSCHINELYTCYQWTGDDAANADFCDQLGGTPTSGPCPSAGQVGGCRTPSPFGGSGCAVNWGYSPGIGADDVRADCTDKQGQFISR